MWWCQLLSSLGANAADPPPAEVASHKGKGTGKEAMKGKYISLMKGKAGKNGGKKGNPSTGSKGKAGSAKGSKGKKTGSKGKGTNENQQPEEVVPEDSSEKKETEDEKEDQVETGEATHEGKGGGKGGGKGNDKNDDEDLESVAETHKDSMVADEDEKLEEQRDELTPPEEKDENSAQVYQKWTQEEWDEWNKKRSDFGGQWWDAAECLRPNTKTHHRNRGRSIKYTHGFPVCYLHSMLVYIYVWHES